jgi:hypothetical protein
MKTLAHFYTLAEALAYLDDNKLDDAIISGPNFGLYYVLDPD